MCSMFVFFRLGGHNGPFSPWKFNLEENEIHHLNQQQKNGVVYHPKV